MNFAGADWTSRTHNGPCYPKEVTSLRDARPGFSLTKNKTTHMKTIEQLLAEEPLRITEDAERVVRIVSKRTEVSPTRITGPTKPQAVVMARQMCYWLLRLRGWEYVAIGKFFKRHHGSVMHGCLCVNIRFDMEPRFKMFWPEFADWRVAGTKYQPKGGAE